MLFSLLFIVFLLSFGTMAIQDFYRRRIKVVNIVLMLLALAFIMIYGYNKVYKLNELIAALVTSLLVIITNMIFKTVAWADIVVLSFVLSLAFITDTYYIFTFMFLLVTILSTVISIFFKGFMFADIDIEELKKNNLINKQKSVGLPVITIEFIAFILTMFIKSLYY